MKILAMTSQGLGDTIMTAPALKLLKHHFPQSLIYLLMHPHRNVRALVEMMTYVDSCIEMKLAGYSYSQLVRFGFRRFWPLVIRLRKMRFDRIICFRPNPLRKLLIRCLGVRDTLYETKLSGYQGSNAVNLLRPWGIHGESFNFAGCFAVSCPKDHIQEIACERPLIIVHPFSPYKWKTWPYFDELIPRLRRLGKVVIVGKPVGKSLLEPTPTCLNDLFWLIKNAQVLVTNDSGPMHIGFAMGTPTVAMFGCVSPTLLIPPGLSTANPLYKATADSETLRRITRTTKDSGNLGAITVNEVFKTVKGVLIYASMRRNS